MRTDTPRPIILGSYSPSQNGIVVSPHGITLCITGVVMDSTPLY